MSPAMSAYFLSLFARVSTRKSPTLTWSPPAGLRSRRSTRTLYSGTFFDAAKSPIRDSFLEPPFARHSRPWLVGGILPGETRMACGFVGGAAASKVFAGPGDCRACWSRLSWFSPHPAMKTAASRSVASCRVTGTALCSRRRWRVVTPTSQGLDHNRPHALEVDYYYLVEVLHPLLLPLAFRVSYRYFRGSMEYPRACGWRATNIRFLRWTIAKRWG